MRPSLVGLVGLGGALGAMARYLAGEVIARRWPSSLPVGTLAINVVGSLALAILAALATHGRIGEPARLFLATGLLGGFTTYSTFNQETLALLERGELGRAALYLGLTVAGGLLAGALGWWLGAAMLR